MQEASTRRLDAIFTALASPARRRILARLVQGPASAGELARPFRISAPAISHHLRVLEDARLIVRRKQAQKRLFRLDRQGFEAASAWLDDYGSGRASRAPAGDASSK